MINCGWINCKQLATIIVVCICADGHTWEVVLCGKHIYSWEDHARPFIVCGCGLPIAEYDEVPAVFATEEYVEEHGTD